MSIESTDWKHYLPASVSDASSNGGSESNTEWSPASFFPAVTHSERSGGMDDPPRYRKAFVHQENSEGLTAHETRYGIDADSVGGDYIRVALGTADDVQGDIDATYEWAGTGLLNSAATAGDDEIEVDFGAVSDEYEVSALKAGARIYVTRKENIDDDDVSHTAEYHEVDSVSWVGSVATVALVGTLSNSYSTSYDYDGTTVHTRVAVLLEPGDTEASADNYSVSSSSGTIDESGNPVQTDNKGTVEDSITLTFSDSENYAIAGTAQGSLGTGSILSDKTVTNSAKSATNFVIPAALFGGTFANGDTVSFDLHAASFAVWWAELVPAGVSSQANNSWRWMLYWESA